jgi:hypothetical protein
MERIAQNRISIILITLVTIAFTLLLRCAHPVAPTGGPKDEAPPQVIQTTPPDYSINFSERKIEIEFDEFIELKDQAKEVFTSPPMINKPELTVRGKKLIIQLNEELRDNLTYVINFGSAVVDIRERNPLTGLSYVFSTGDAIDSLLIAGKIMNAFDLTPAENVLFAVHQPDQDTLDPDSLFLKVPPLSAIRTREDGSFLLTNLPGGEYLAYALEDLNSNFYYDLPTEKIAFLDSLIVPEYIKMTVDTSEADSSGYVNVTASGMPQNPISLYLFEEFDPTQRILSSAMTKTGSLLIVFRLPVEEVEITPLNFTSPEEWMISEYTTNNDTLILWPRDYERDTFEILINLGDTILDTLSFARKTQETGGLLRRKTSPDDYVQLKFNIKAGVLSPGKALRFKTSEPIADYDFSSSLLYLPDDTIQAEIQLTDSIGNRGIVVHEWKDNSVYGLYIPDSILTGISGKSNDSVKIVFRTKPIEDYGSLVMSFLMGDPGAQYIIEFMNEKDIVVQSDVLVSDTIIHYRHLEPGSYRFKAIVDSNRNGKWDTGNLSQKVQPEHVFYYIKNIAVRSNWELQEEWQLEN